MADDMNKPAPGGRVLSREEARSKRQRFLALAAEQEREERDSEEADWGEPTVATMILPGD